VPSQRERVIMEEEDHDRDDAESDVFDGISHHGASRPVVTQIVPEGAIEEESGGILGATSRAEMEKLNLALLGGVLRIDELFADSLP
jgi:hypothetical protein